MKENTDSIPDGKFTPEDWEYMLLQLVNDHSNVDFSMYRMPTFRRRYMKCMNAVDAQDIRDYVKILENDEEKLNQLVSDLLIGVTSFFRDSAAFRVLNELAIVPLFSESTDEPARAWVAGCSSGMEAYTIAMLMDMASGENGRNYTVFATDICRSALAQASKGVYTKKQFSSVPEEYRKYFIEKNDSWKICRDIRAHMVFSYHDVLSDPPFARMDIVSCRNMMIYLKPNAQDIVLDRLNYSLSTGGHLFLGSGETPGKKYGNLETVDSRWRLFRKTGDTTPSITLSNMDKHYTRAGSTFNDSGYSSPHDDDVFGRSRSFTSCLQERFFPDCVFIDEDYKTLFINGDMNLYLSIPSGVPGGSLLPMLPSRMKAAVRAGVKRAAGGFSRIHCNTSGDVSIHVSCVSPIDMKGVFLIEFTSADSENSLEDENIECSESNASILEEQIAFLESELALARRELRSRTGELQASNEELQTTNEEIRSANEELTASNEELIASNEELLRVNEQLSVLSDDIMNLLESMDVGSLFLDSDLNIRRFNPIVCNFFKITENDFGRAITDFTTALVPESMNFLVQAVRQVGETGTAIEISLEVSYPGYWLAKISPYRTADGSSKGTVITFVDITLLREGEKSLARSERKFRGLFNGFPVGALLVSHKNSDGDFRILNKNPMYEKLQQTYSGLSSNESFVQGILQENSVFQFDHGNNMFETEVFRPADYADTLCVTVRDITVENRINTEKELLQNRLKHSQLMAGMGIWEFDTGKEVVTLSPEAAELLDLSAALPIPVGAFRNLIEDFDSFYNSAGDALVSGNHYSDMVTIHCASDKEAKFFSVKVYPGQNRDNSVFYGYAMDVTSEVRNERILKQAHDRLADTQKLAKIGLLDVEWRENFTSHRERFSESFLDVLKLKKAEGRFFSREFLEPGLPGNLLKKFAVAARNKETVTIDIQAKNGAGENVYLQLIGRPESAGTGINRTSVVIMDITRRHLMENELKHSDKLRSVGELAGGIAHDFNNQLMGIVGFAECLRGVTSEPEHVEFVKGILNSAERAGALVRQLLAFSRKGLSHVAPFDLHHQIDDVISLLERSIDRRIEIRRSLQAHSTIIQGDASEMNNALLNLAINARDAMEGSGILTFATSNHQQGKIKIVVSDTGMGMSDEVKQRVFEPFFTTKPLGDGTGMGLPAVYGTVMAHQGTVGIESEPGRGTKIVIVLPVADVEGVTSKPRQLSDNCCLMEGTILVVDDEQIVRTVLKTLIESLGFSVLTACDGMEAAAVYAENAEDIALVLMDMTMPRMNGIQAFMEMRKVKPDVRVVILSGHSAESSTQEMVNLGIIRVLQKPVTISVLSNAIREIIGN